MDFDEFNDSQNQPEPPLQPEPTPVTPPTQYAPVYQPAPVKKRSGWRFVWRILFTLSIIANVFLFIMLLAISAMFVSGQSGVITEETIRKGAMDRKIVVIRIEGIITNVTSAEFSSQLKAAADDVNVKAIIVRTITPGGSVSASDQIHHQISEFRKRTDKPVVAFMQTVAASGGYYTSVACDSIVAEPTAITGSIGVIMNHFVVKELLQDKLGIEAVVIKSGKKKDWPSPFSETTDEQKAYLYDALIGPAYERFVDLVAQGREQLLTYEEVKQLADGSIFTAKDAQKNNLIDYVGYMDKAIATAQSLAGIRGAQVVEYGKPFSFISILGSQGSLGFKLDRSSIQELTTPQLQYIWNPGL